VNNLNVDIKELALAIGDKKIFLFCGEIHYFRTPKKSWFDVILKAKRAGLNCIASYIPWNWHEPLENLTLFGDEVPPSPYESKAFSRDVEKYIRLIKELGLYFIARPGPYICSEWDSGGHPNWLYKYVKLFRSLDESYIHYTEKWYSLILPIINKYTYAKNGPTVLLQIENEYHWGDVPYLLRLYEIALKYVNDIPIVTNDDWYLDEPPIINTIDDYPSPWNIKSFDEKIKNYMRTQPGMLKMFMELEGGWFSTFGAPLPTSRGSFPPEWTEILIKTAIGMGINGINIYMFYGGTNPGYYTGKFMTTTYDYEAAIREWGELSKRYYAVKRVALFMKTFNDFVVNTKPAENVVEATNKGIEVFARADDKGSVLAILRNFDAGSKHTKVLYKGNVYPYHGIIRVPPRNAKMILLNYSINGTPFTIAYTTSEPLLLSVYDKKVVLVVYGDPLEQGEMLVHSSDRIDPIFSLDVSIDRLSDKSIIVSYVCGSSDRLVSLRSGGYELYIVAISRSRADRTWYIDDFEPPLIIISNIYYIGRVNREGNGSVSVELELDKDSCGPSTIASFEPISRVSIAGRSIDIENLSGILYKVQLSVCEDAEKPSIRLSDAWKIAKEFQPWEGAIVEAGIPLEQLDMLFNGYALYTIEFNLSQEDIAKLVNNILYISYFNDYATITLNGTAIASDYHSIEVDASKTLKEGANKLRIVVESIGHANDGFLYMPNGLVGGIYIGKIGEYPLTQWIYIDYTPPYGRNFSLAKFLHYPEDVEKIISDPKMLENAVVVDSITRGMKIYINKVNIENKSGRYILDLGEGRYRNNYARALIFINKKFIGIYVGPTDITDHIVEGENEIIVVPERIPPTLYPSIKRYQAVIKGMWRIKYHTYGLEEKWFNKEFNDDDWTSTRIPLTIDGHKGEIVWLRGKVEADMGMNTHPMKLVFKASGVRALLFFNGQLLGRYVDEGPQTEFYIPEALMENGVNSIAIMLHIVDSRASVDRISIEPYYTHMKTVLSLYFDYKQ